MNFFRRLSKKEKSKESSDTAKERLHLVLMQDRANVSADYLELMRQEIIEVIKKYVDIDEKAIDVKLTSKTNEDGTTGAPALYANIPIITIKNETRKMNIDQNSKDVGQAQKSEPKNQATTSKTANSKPEEKDKLGEQKAKQPVKKQEENSKEIKPSEDKKEAKEVKSEENSQEKQQTKPKKDLKSKSKSQSSNLKNQKTNLKSKEVASKK